MRIIPLAEFYEKHGEQLMGLLPKSGGDSSFLTDLASAVVPVLKKHKPQLNANGLLDDALALLKTETEPEQPAQPASADLG